MQHVAICHYICVHIVYMCVYLKPGAGFPRDRRIPYHMPGLMDALRTFGVRLLIVVSPFVRFFLFRNSRICILLQVGYKRQADRGKRALEEEMGLVFPPAFIHGEFRSSSNLILSFTIFFKSFRKAKSLLLALTHG